MRTFYYFSNRQIQEMKMAIGWDPNKITGTKYRQFKTERNVFFTKEDHTYWNKLCDQGLAEKQERTDTDGYIYRLSIDGVTLLEEITDVKITFGKG